MATTTDYGLGPSRAVQQFARFETKRGSGSGAGYERWRSWEYRPHTPRDGKQDVFVPHHRLLAVVACYPEDMPVGEVLAHLKGRDVHHKSGVEWDNRPDNLAVREHGTHAEITQAQMRAWAEDARDRATGPPTFDQDRCDNCGDEADVLASSSDFDGEVCIACAKRLSDGAPIEVG